VTWTRLVYPLRAHEGHGVLQVPREACSLRRVLRLLKQRAELFQNYRASRRPWRNRLGLEMSEEASQSGRYARLCGARAGRGDTAKLA
jgi:hypothetical protein